MATLKISELSVGDWVRVINQFNAQIDGYHSGSGSLSLKTRQGNLVHYRLEDIRPIPITAEILEKNGWRVIEKEVLGDDYEYDGEKRVWDDYNIDICETKPGVFWYSWRSEYYMWRLEYVHKLQHLIRLAGADKEINL